MKKTLSMILSALMLTGMVTTASAFEKGVDYVVIEEVDPDNYVGYGGSYPGSGEWDWPECTSGQLLKGTIISSVDENGNHCWKNTPTGNASAAFDGDTSTLFDPFEASDRSWAGMILDQAYELTEARIMVRGKYLERMKNAAIQGSQDGEKWVTIVYFGQNAEAEDYHIITPEPITDEDYLDAGYTDYSTYWVGYGSYKMYRYVNLGRNHGEAIEIELYGNPAPATEVTDELVAATSFQAVNFYNGSYEETSYQSTSIDGSLVGTVIGAGGFYKENADYGYEKAWDNDPTTFYDPAEMSSNCWTGIKLDRPVALKEIRIMPRAEWLDRTIGAHVQGSNDGKTWVTLASYNTEDCATEQTWIRRAVNIDMEFTMFRYVNNGARHGDIVDIALFEDDGVPVDIPVETQAPETAAPETQAPETAAPETQAPETAAPETQAPETAAPETVAPETAAPETQAPETTLPDNSTAYIYVGEIAYTGVQAPAVADNSIVGQIIGGASTSEGNEFEKAFDGELTTWWNGSGAIYDMWVGIKTASPVVVKSFSVATQDNDGDGVSDRRHAMWGSRLQGSNDGVTWEDIYVYEYVDYEDYAYDEENTYFTKELNNTKAYTYFRYLNNDDGANAIAELQLFGDATQPEAPQTFDAGVIAAVAAVVSAAGYAISKKRK